MTRRNRLRDELLAERFDPKQLRRGMEHEFEHTDDPEIAASIAKDHLREDPAYYDLLESVMAKHNPLPFEYVDVERQRENVLRSSLRVAVLDVLEDPGSAETASLMVAQLIADTTGDQEFRSVLTRYLAGAGRERLNYSDYHWLKASFENVIPQIPRDTLFHIAERAMRVHQAHMEGHAAYRARANPQRRRRW